MTTPKSVRVLNSHPYQFGKWQLGTVLNNLILFARELHDEFAVSGNTLATLVNELRTIAGTVRTLANEVKADYNAANTLLSELRTRLHTAGDYQVLIAELRSRLVTTGDMFEMLVDLSDKAYNMLLTDPGWAEAAAPTSFENVAQIDAIVDGVYYAALVAAGTDIAPDASWATGAGETKIVTLSVDGAGTVTQTASIVGATTPPRPPTGECPIGVVNVPANFNPGVTQIAAGGVTFLDGFPRRLNVPVTVAAPAPAAIVAPAATAVVAADVAAVTTAAITAPTATKPDALPDHY